MVESSSSSSAIRLSFFDSVSCSSSNCVSCVLRSARTFAIESVSFISSACFLCTSWPVFSISVSASCISFCCWARFASAAAISFRARSMSSVNSSARCRFNSIRLRCVPISLCRRCNSVRPSAISLSISSSAWRCSASWFSPMSIFARVACSDSPRRAISARQLASSVSSDSSCVRE